MKPVLSTLGAVGAAFAASLCCAEPLLHVALGVGGMGLASTFAPLPTPWPGTLLVLALAMFPAWSTWIL